MGLIQPQGLGAWVSELAVGMGCSLPALSERLHGGFWGLWGGVGEGFHRMQEPPTIHLGSQLPCPLYMRQSALLLCLEVRGGGVVRARRAPLSREGEL